MTLHLLSQDTSLSPFPVSFLVQYCYPSCHCHTTFSAGRALHAAVHHGSDYCTLRCGPAHLWADTVRRYVEWSQNLLVRVRGRANLPGRLRHRPRMAQYPLHLYKLKPRQSPIPSQTNNWGQKKEGMQPENGRLDVNCLNAYGPTCLASCHRCSTPRTLGKGPFPNGDLPIRRLSAASRAGQHVAPMYNFRSAQILSNNRKFDRD